jgi:hypothetical protein
MTAKQKAAREKFKKVVAEAGKLRKKNPKLTQAQAVKQAWAMSYSEAGVVKKKAAPKKVAAIKIIEKGESKSSKVKATYQQVRTKKGTFKGLKKVGAMDKSHKDTKSHNVNIRVVSGIPPYKDPDAAREIELYADNDSRLYFSRKLPILKNLQKKFQKGNYNVELAAKLWMYYINDAMQRYNKEFGSRGDKWSDLLSVADRKLLAIEYAKETLNEFQQGNFIV